MFCGARRSRKRHHLSLDTISISSSEASSYGMARDFSNRMDMLLEEQSDCSHPHSDYSGMFSDFSDCESDAVSGPLMIKLDQHSLHHPAGYNPDGPMMSYPHPVPGETCPEQHSPGSHTDTSGIFSNNSGSFSDNSSSVSNHKNIMKHVKEQLKEYQRRLECSRSNAGTESVKSGHLSDVSGPPSVVSGVSNTYSNTDDPDAILAGLIRDLECYQHCECDCDSESDWEETKEYFFGPETAPGYSANQESGCTCGDLACQNENSTGLEGEDLESEDYCVIDAGMAWHLYQDSSGEHPDISNLPEALAGRRAIWTKGQLKIDIYVNHGLLTVHIIQARHLSSKYKSTCSSYVKVSLVPDHKSRTKCKTELIEATNTPNYDEKFSFELTEEDYQKRLLISVWHSDPNKKQNELLGCMSFGILHILLQRKQVEGWYYLLTEDLGKGKHLQATAQQGPLVERRENIETSDLVGSTWMESHHSIVIERRGENGGFGFTVTGYNPVTIGRVHPDSPAEAAGLRKGDYVISVNRLNVVRSAADSVAKIVKHADTRLVLEVTRPHQVLPHELVLQQASAAPSDCASSCKENSTSLKSCWKIPGLSAGKHKKVTFENV